MIRKSFTKLKRIIFSGLVMSLCTFVFNPTTPANAAMVHDAQYAVPVLRSQVEGVF